MAAYIVVGYSLKNQGSYNTDIDITRSWWLDIHLKIKAVTTRSLRILADKKLDIHLKIKLLTTCKLELGEFQRYIVKIK